MFDNIKNNILVALLSGIFYGVIWNTIHPMMHKFNIDITWKDGIPNLKNVKLNNIFYKWLLKNHSLHHYQKDNKGNYNILLPQTIKHLLIVLVNVLTTFTIQQQTSIL